MIPKRFLKEQFDDIEASRAELNQRELELEAIEQRMENLLTELSLILDEVEDLASIEGIKKFQQKIMTVFQEKFSNEEDY